MLNSSIYKRFYRVLVGFLVSAFAVTGVAQDDEIVFDVDLLTFEVAVTDKQGKPIRGLDKDDFVVQVDGKKRPIDFFSPITRSRKGRPLSVVFALDISGSITKPELVRLRDSMQKFVDRLADYDSYFAVVTFGMRVKRIQSFTNKPRRLRKAFKKILEADDGLSTHAYDAVDYAVQMIRKKSPKRLKNQVPKRVVIVISDGFPVGDLVTPETVIKRANTADTSVYSVILPSFSRLSNTQPILTPFQASGVVEQTGGKSLYATEKDFEPLFRSLAEEITASYAIAFYPKDEERDGKKRSVEIVPKSDAFKVRQNKPDFTIKP